jgi:peptidoglycan/LPS O-acetylase OafA/YrhL
MTIGNDVAGDVRITTGKVLFADQLRGIAALMVVISHFAGIYWFERPLVSAVTFSPLQEAAVPAGAAALLNALPFNPGPLGVAVFFLISGFVIPFSFRHHNARSFLLARLLRIYPTYLAALALGLAARAASAAYWGESFSIKPISVIGNALLVHDLVGMSSIDLVNWTLVIELKFYLLFALARTAILRWKGGFVLVLSLLALVVNVAASFALSYLPQRLGYAVMGLAHEAMFLPFMLLGTLFYLRLLGNLTIGHLATASVLALALFLGAWKVGPMTAAFDSAAVSYIWGWGIFGLCFLVRERAVALAPLRWLSAISYPLYLVHSMLGYVLMQALMLGHGIAYPVAAAAALLVALGAAWAIHHWVERPSIERGKALGRTTAPRPVLAA